MMSDKYVEGQGHFLFFFSGQMTLNETAEKKPISDYETVCGLMQHQITLTM